MLPRLAVSTGAGATLCGAAAANLSLNMIEVKASARELCAAGSDSAANTSLTAGGRAGRARGCDRSLDDGRVDRRRCRATDRRWPRRCCCKRSSAQPSTRPRPQRCRGNVAGELRGKISCGCGPHGQRTGTRTHLRVAQNSSTLSPLDAACRTNSRRSISQRRGASLRRLLVKCGLSAGGSEAWHNRGSMREKASIAAIFTAVARLSRVDQESRCDATFQRQRATGLWGHDQRIAARYPSLLQFRRRRAVEHVALRPLQHIERIGLDQRAGRACAGRRRPSRPGENCPSGEAALRPTSST